MINAGISWCLALQSPPKMHCGLQIVLNGDATAGDLRDNLSYIYGLYVEYVMKNPLYTPGKPFRSGQPPDALITAAMRQDESDEAHLNLDISICKPCCGFECPALQNVCDKCEGLVYNVQADTLRLCGRMISYQPPMSLMNI